MLLHTDKEGLVMQVEAYKKMSPAAVRLSVAELPTLERRVIEDRYGFNMTHICLPPQEIAVKRGLTPAQVREIEERAIKKLRAELGLLSGVQYTRVKPEYLRSPWACV